MILASFKNDSTFSIKRLYFLGKKIVLFEQKDCTFSEKRDLCKTFSSSHKFTYNHIKSKNKAYLRSKRAYIPPI